MRKKFNISIRYLKISIIIPIYNMEKYLYQCLNSILNQTFKNLEIICIDDGSTDNSYKILKEYANKDKRIIVLQQENKGAGATRNKGLRIATGDFVSFLDADDFFEANMLETALERIQETNADFVIYNSNQFDDKTKTFINPNWFIRYGYFPSKKVFSYHQISGNIFLSIVGWAWDKLYRTDFIKKHNLQFQEQRTTNDALFVFSALFLAKRISLLDKKKRLVHHRINNFSSLENTRSKSWYCFYNMLTALKARIIKENKFNELEHDFINYALNFSLWNLNTLPEPTHSKLKEKLQNEWFEFLGITSKTEDYFENKKEYLQMQSILNDIPKNNIQLPQITNIKGAMYMPLLFRDIGLGCNTYSEPKVITGSNVKIYTYDLSDEIYTRYVIWNPIKNGSFDVEIKRLSAIEKHSKKIIEFAVNKIDNVEFQGQKGYWIGYAVEGAYESFTIEATIKNI